MANDAHRNARSALSRLTDRVWHFKRVRKIARMEEAVHGGCFSRHGPDALQTVRPGGVRSGRDREMRRRHLRVTTGEGRGAKIGGGWWGFAGHLQKAGVYGKTVPGGG